MGGSQARKRAIPDRSSTWKGDSQAADWNSPGNKLGHHTDAHREDQSPLIPLKDRSSRYRPVPVRLRESDCAPYSPGMPRLGGGTLSDVGRQATMRGHQADSQQCAYGNTGGQNDAEDRASGAIQSGPGHSFTILLAKSVFLVDRRSGRPEKAGQGRRDGTSFMSMRAEDARNTTQERIRKMSEKSEAVVAATAWIFLSCGVGVAAFMGDSLHSRQEN